MNVFRAAEFFTTINDLRSLPMESRAEIAFAGRSNAGKSSAINTLANRNRLAYVSKTPGRTQHINYFSLGDACFLVDLPGYGFAKVPGAVKDHWRGLLSDYLQQRAVLVGLMLIMDIRRPLTDLDLTMLEWFLPTGKPVHCLLTKSDKISHGAANAVLHQVRTELAAMSDLFTVQLFSSLKKTGVETAAEVAAGWLKMERAEKTSVKRGD